MTQKRLFGISGAIATAALIGGLLAGCMEKDLYDPDYGKEPLPDPSEYFGFETRGDVKLSVNYDVPGLVALLEVYDEDPMEVVDNVPVKKEGVEALFKIFTDGNGKYEGKMNIPTSVETVYLYTSSWGVPRCVKLDIKDGMASFDMSKKEDVLKVFDVFVKEDFLSLEEEKQKQVLETFRKVACRILSIPVLICIHCVSGEKEEISPIFIIVKQESQTLLIMDM